MSTFNITGNDTLVLNSNVFNDMAADDITSITFPNELVTLKTGKEGNTILAQNRQGQNSVLTLRLMRGSSDDQFLQNLLSSSLSDFPSSQLLSGSFVKRLGDGAGNVRRDVYTLAGGAFSKIPDAKENTSGDTGQAETVYTIKFANVIRSIE